MKPSPISPRSPMSSIVARCTSSARTWLSPITRSRGNWKRVTRKSAIFIRVGSSSEPHTNADGVASADRAILLSVLNDVRVVKLVRVREVDGVGRQNDVRRHTELNAGVELIVRVREFRHAG